MTPSEFAELVATKRKAWRVLMNPKRAPFYKLPLAKLAEEFQR